MARRQLPNYIAAALNLPVHSHVLAFDGAYVERGDELVFVPAPPPTPDDTLEVSSRVAERVASYFIRVGSVPTSAAEYRGFSIHAGVAISGPDAEGRDRLVRYVTRPPFAEQQVQLCRGGRVAFRLTHPKPSGETHLFLHPMTLLRRVTSQIPPLGMNLVRYHGVLAPAAKRRSKVGRTAPPPHSPSAEGAGPSYLPNYSWAALLKRVFDVDALKCPDCGAQMRILAAIEDRDIIDRILTYLGMNATPTEPAPSRAGDLFTPSYSDTG